MNRKWQMVNGKCEEGGFTLLETLVAVAILMITIGSAFALAPEGLIGARFARNQTTATYLAQEGLEVVRVIRDNAMFFAPNGADPLNWLVGLSSCIDRWCTVNPITTKVTPCDVGEACPALKFIPASDGPDVYGNGVEFAINPAAQPSIFTRQVRLTKVTNNTIGPGRNDTEVQVTVRVSWQEGRTTKDTQVSENLFDWWTSTK